jgi:hypothetical protein
VDKEREKGRDLWQRMAMWKKALKSAQGPCVKAHLSSVTASSVNLFVLMDWSTTVRTLFKTDTDADPDKFPVVAKTSKFISSTPGVTPSAVNTHPWSS